MPNDDKLTFLEQLSNVLVGQTATGGARALGEGIGYGVGGGALSDIPDVMREALERHKVKSAAPKPRSEQDALELASALAAMSNPVSLAGHAVDFAAAVPSMIEQKLSGEPLPTGEVMQSGLKRRLAKGGAQARYALEDKLGRQAERFQNLYGEATPPASTMPDFELKYYAENINKHPEAMRRAMDKRYPMRTELHQDEIADIIRNPRMYDENISFSPSRMPADIQIGEQRFQRGKGEEIYRSLNPEAALQEPMPKINELVAQARGKQAAKARTKAAPKLKAPVTRFSSGNDIAAALKTRFPNMTDRQIIETTQQILMGEADDILGQLKKP